MKIAVAAVTDSGVTHEKNDDSVLVGTRVLREGGCGMELEIPALLAVCDGVGGYAGGDVASEAVLQDLAGYSPNRLASENTLLPVLETINDKLLSMKAENPELRQMCTTIAGVVLLKDRTVLFHAGDSRIYRFDGTFLRQMTYDHSLVQDQIDQGAMTAEEASRYGCRNQISRAMGLDKEMLPEIRIIRQPMMPGETYLLCSDGLWDCVTREEMTEVLLSDHTLAGKAGILVEMAKAQGSLDNISVCIAQAPPAQKKEEKRPFMPD